MYINFTIWWWQLAPIFPIISVTRFPSLSLSLSPYHADLIIGRRRPPSTSAASTKSSEGRRFFFCFFLICLIRRAREPLRHPHTHTKRHSHSPHTLVVSLNQQETHPDLFCLHLLSLNHNSNISASTQPTNHSTNQQPTSVISTTTTHSLKVLPVVSVIRLDALSVVLLSYLLPDLPHSHCHPKIQPPMQLPLHKHPLIND